MKVVKNNFVALALIIGISILPIFAQFNRENGYGNRDERYGNRGNERQVRALINQIEVKSDNFRNQLNRELYDTNNNSQTVRYINQTVTNFEDAVDRMKQNHSDNRDIKNDLRDVLAKANQIENLMRQYRFNPQTENTWRVLKADLNSLSRYSNSNGNWNNQNYSSLNGTYRLNVNQSDDVNSAIDRVLYDSSNNRLERQRISLQKRLAVPETLSIERTNSTIKMASSNANQTTFEANGRPQTEYLSDGRTMTNTVSLSGDKLIINSDGDQVNAFYIAFEPFQNGQKMKVTRKLFLESRSQTITVQSVYDKTANVAQWNLYSNDGYSNVNYPNNNYGYGNNRFYVQNGTPFVATLNNDLSTRQIYEGERFSMTVTSPSAYYGAIIEGTVSKTNRSGRVSGNAELGLNFETIRLRNGSTYRFAGLIDSVTNANGKTIKVDNENSIQSGSQTKDTVVRSGVGAAIGAIIGGIAGGGKGAAIGGAIGAGAGGGSVLVQGRDDIELKNGSTFYITASSNVR